MGVKLRAQAPHIEGKRKGGFLPLKILSAIFCLYPQALLFTRHSTEVTALASPA
jgi:hypothetical protein